MALTKVQKTGITDNAIDADKIEDGTIVAADIAPGTITNAKLAGSIANDKLANSSITVNGSSVSLGGSVTAGKIQWQSVKTADFNAVAGEGYFVDTDSVGAVTATLPGSPSAGDTIAFKDYAENFGTNALTIARNGSNIQGVANDSVISTNRASVVLVYIDSTKGWLFTNESNVADLAPSFVSATGGTLTTSGDYKIHSFTGDGCFVVSCAGNPGGSSSVQVLVVGGGGGSGTGHPTSGVGGGGGGAGGLILVPEPVGTPVSATTYPVTIGGGGTAGTIGSTDGGVGTDTTALGLLGKGGGGGATRLSPAPGATGGTGGSGGGASYNCSPTTVPTSTATQPVQTGQSGTYGFGNVGGGYPSCLAGGPNSTGGGGGAGTAGGPAGPSPVGSGDGGDGKSVTAVFGASPQPFYGPTNGVYAGGGGGGGGEVSGGAAGPGGGGAGNPSTGNNGNAGAANTGGGAGGGAKAGPTGAAGGKGIVIIRYKFQ